MELRQTQKGEIILTISSLKDLREAALNILELDVTNRIFLFYGDMGAGKTTLIKALCACLGTLEPVTSPTFSIVNEYSIPGNKIYHFDFYRLKNQTEALDLGYEEYFYSGAYCFVEWPEKIPALLPDTFVKAEITVAAGGARQITLHKI